jgi:hypothetical protein
VLFVVNNPRGAGLENLNGFTTKDTKSAKGSTQGAATGLN